MGHGKLRGRRVSDARSNGPRASRAPQEGLKETATTVAAMKDANKDLKKQFKKININQVEDMQDDMADLLEQAEEIQNAMGRSYNTDDIDEADLEAELAAMEDDPSLCAGPRRRWRGGAAPRGALVCARSCRGWQRLVSNDGWQACRRMRPAAGRSGVARLRASRVEAAKACTLFIAPFALTHSFSPGSHSLTRRRVPRIAASCPPRATRARRPTILTCPRAAHSPSRPRARRRFQRRSRQPPQCDTSACAVRVGAAGVRAGGRRAGGCRGKEEKSRGEHND